MKKITLAFCLWLAMALPALAIDSIQLFDTIYKHISLATEVQSG